jgi:hypothetical protein
VQKKTDQLTGSFRLTSGREVFGTLCVHGEHTTISLFDDDEFNRDPESYSYIRGELHDGRFVTLIQCILKRIETRSISSDKRKHSATIFPHFVALGSSHVSPSEPCISQVHFVMRDASAVFYDFDAFSTIINPTPFIPLLKNDKAMLRQVDIGENPIIAYFTGKFDVAVVETALGEVRTHHRPIETIGGPRGVRIDNEVMVTLTPPNPLTFEEGINRLSILSRFFELVLGREQPLTHLSVSLCNSNERSLPIEIYRSMAPDPRGAVDFDESRSPGPRDVLVTTVEGTEQYSTILRNYLALDQDRHDSRGRLQRALNTGRHYTIDRLIAAANIFDILPNSVYPAKVSLSEGLATAKAKARKLFKALPDSIERSSILGAIGRIGELSLKHKIRHRVTSAKLDKLFPQLVDVLEEAVNCRNHYVHGTQGRIDYSSNFDLVPFFTDSLEFSFAASDLIDSGWDISSWKNNLPQYSHPFGAFIINYRKQIKHFNKIMCSAS